jgi:hypothetical protein
MKRQPDTAPCQNVLGLLLQSFLSLFPLRIRTGGRAELVLEEVRGKTETILGAWMGVGWRGGKGVKERRGRRGGRV